ncbi:MAG TPA: murein L,D-transpeptidase catalytic domain family protein [Pedobacter sp.]|nr:murein L,D-transpeptidase catalytic domain family protein [Pedobacter sp.]
MTKKYLVAFLILCAGFTNTFAAPYNSKIPVGYKNFESRVSEALQYCRENKMNTSFCIMVDMSIHSGKNRLFVYDFKRKEVIVAGLCAHGIGGNSGPNKVAYSNKVNSNCTSLGKYKLGIRSYSKWGIHVHYKMYGLENTNDKAFERIVVLHSYTPVPAFETYPAPMFGVSLGCPVVADVTMRKIDKLIRQGQRNMLLWIYE